MCTNHIWFICLPIDGHLDCSLTLVTVNNAAVNMRYRCLLVSLISCLLDSVSGSELAGSCDRSVYNLLNICYTVFHSSCTIFFFFFVEWKCRLRIWLNSKVPFAMKRRHSFSFLQIFLIHRANGNVLIIVESLIFWEIHLNCCLDENDFN